ncbi:MAG: Flp pilus assembly complex ATPase component TadA [Sphingomonadales bacterium]|nr:Flp pilus assembly complex ATPase component TadA [Sphingomonadales bacterium]
MGGAIERHDIAELSTATLDRLARQIARLPIRRSAGNIRFSASLPDGARIRSLHRLRPEARWPLQSRKHLSRELRSIDYAAAGAFDTIRRDAVPRHVADDETLARLKAGGDFAGLLKEAVRQRRNILIAGGTAAGKTTFLNALISEIAAKGRLVLIEMRPNELRHANAVGLVAARSPLQRSNCRYGTIAQCEV